MALTPAETRAQTYHARGGVDEPVGPEGVQVAGLGKEIIEAGGNLMKFLGIIGDSPGSVKTIEKPSPEIGVRGPERFPEPSNRDAGRVPTRQEETLLDAGSYEVTKRARAKEMLSPEGQDRFKEQGYKARPPGGEDSPDLILEQARAAVSDEVAQARSAVADETAGRPPTEGQRGLVDEGQVEDLLTQQQRVQQAIIDVDQVDMFGARTDIKGIDFNFDHIQTGADVKALFNALSELYRDPIESAKRGVRTHIETEKAADELLADELGMTRTLLNRQVGQVFNAENMLAARKLVVKSAEQLQKLSELVSTGQGSPEHMLKLRRQMAIHAALMMQAKGAVTELGRAMNAFKIPASSQRSPMVRGEEILALLNQSGGALEAQKLAKGYLNALKEGGREQGNRMVARSWGSKWSGVAQELYMNGLLGWTKTIFKNLIGTPTWMLYQLAEEVVAGSIGSTVRLVRRGFGFPPAKEGVYIGQAVARVAGWANSFDDAWHVAWKTWKTEVPSDQQTKIDALSYRQLDSENLGIRPGSQVMGVVDAGEAVNTLGRLIRIPGRFLQATDDFWKVFASRGELNSQAWQATANARQAGKSPQEALDDGLMVYLDPKSVGDATSAQAHYSTLTQDIGALGELTSKVQHMTWLGLPVGRMIIPFAKVPTNSVLITLGRNPVVQLLNPKAYADSIGLHGPAAQQKRLAQLAMGTAVMTSVVNLATNGRLTGGYPRDEAVAKTLPPGWQPYSMVFKSSREGYEWPKDADGDDLPLINNETGLYNGEVMYVSYAGVEPVGAMLGITSDIIERMRRTQDPVKTLDFAGIAMFSFVDYFLNVPFLQGFSSMYNAMSRSDLTYLTNSPLGNMLALPTGGLIPGTPGIPIPVPRPFSAAWRNIGAALDPVSGRPSSPIDYYTLDDVRNMPLNSNGSIRTEFVGLPKGGAGQFFSKMVIEGYLNSMRDSPGYNTRDTLAVNYDPLGEEMLRSERFDTNPMIAGWNMFMPFKVRYGEAPTRLQQELVSLDMPISRESSRYIQGIRLSEKNRSDWTRIAKNETFVMGRVLGLPGSEVYDFRSALNGLILSPKYKNPPRSERKETETRGPLTKDEWRAAKIKLMEYKFYRAAVPSLLALPENDELSLVIDQRRTIDQLQYEAE
jgi:hypothetical protein